MNKPSIKKNFAYNTLYQSLSLITPFITAPYLARVLGAENIGIQSYTTSIQSYFLLFAALGTQTYGAREIARNRDDVKTYSKLFWEIELMTVITSLISLIAWLVLVIVSVDYKIYFIAMFPNLFATMFNITWFFNGLEEFKLTVVRNIFFEIAGIVLMFLCVKTGDDLFKYIIILSILKMLSSLVMWTYIPKYTTKIDLKKLNILKHFRQTLLYFIPTIATSIYTVLDKTLIGIITNDNSQNGYYEQAQKVIRIAKSISFTSINSVVGVRMSYLFAEKCIDEINTRIKNSINYILFMGIGCACGISGIARNFVPTFFGDGYANVEYLLYIFSPIIIIIGISNCLETHYYTPSGRRAKSTKYLIVGSCVNLIFNILMIPKFGAYGAAAASIIAELTITILYIINSDSYLNFSLLLRAGSKKLVAGVIMLVTVFGIGEKLNFDIIITLVIQILIGVCIYICMLMILKDEWVISFVKSIKDKFMKK